MHPPYLALWVALVLVAEPSVTLAQATKLPAPSRTVYKCVENGRTTFSDDPCPGAEAIQVEPTRGVNKMTGQARTGTDVRREEHREQWAEAFKPLTGLEAKDYEKAERRMKLQPAAQRECAALDRHIARNEQLEKSSSDAERDGVQRTLFLDRQRFRKLGC